MSLRSVTVALVVLGACAGGDASGPRGEAADVVAAAPGRTVDEGTARVETSTRQYTATGRVDLRAGTARVTIEPQPPAGATAVLADPALAVDLVRGAINVEFYGGNEVRGVSTFRYEVDVDPELARTAAPPAHRDRLEALTAALRAPTFFADVWVDADGRLRRVQFPTDLNEPRPRGRSREVPDVVTVDLFDFGS